MFYHFLQFDGKNIITELWHFRLFSSFQSPWLHGPFEEVSYAVVAETLAHDLKEHHFKHSIVMAFPKYHVSREDILEAPSGCSCASEILLRTGSWYGRRWQPGSKSGISSRCRCCPQTATRGRGKQTTTHLTCTPVEIWETLVIFQVDTAVVALSHKTLDNLNNLSCKNYQDMHFEFRWLMLFPTKTGTIWKHYPIITCAVEWRLEKSFRMDLMVDRSNWASDFKDLPKTS